jgi:hypothetical protein
MPTYTFVDTTTGSENTEMMKISELETYLLANPNLKQKLSTPAFGDPVRLGVHKQPGSWNDLVKEINKNNHGEINSKNGEL